jgi:hypothetical protein
MTRSVPSPAGVFLFANNKMRDNPDQIELVGIVPFMQQRSNFVLLSKHNLFLDKISLESETVGNACRNTVFTIDLGGREMGCLMKSGIATQSLLLECYVLQIDGQTKSEHRLFVDALRAGLLLKELYPHHDIKVRAPNANRALKLQ